ncbi:hypothetical protein GUITHDRAFT_46876, partial [Guillardia theta CCMP2712]
QPKCLGTQDNLKLKPYQLVGLNWLRTLHTSEVNGILADEMGLGKTIQTIAFLAHIYEKKVSGPHIIVCPASVVSNWNREFSQWLPSLRVVVYHGSQKERAQIRSEMHDTSSWFACTRVKVLLTLSRDVVVTTYTCFEREAGKQDRAFLRSFNFKVMILDEAHSIKNAGSSRYRHLLHLTCERRILLTGTPINNNLPELLVLLQFLMPELFDPDDEVESESGNLARVKMRQKGCSCSHLLLSHQKVNVERVKKMIKPFVLRRCKCDVLGELVPKDQQVIQKEISDYSDFVLHQMCQDHKRLNKLSLKVQSIFPAIRPSHLFVQPEDISSSAKLRKLEEILPRLQSEGHRVLLFSQWTTMLDIIEDFLIDKDYLYTRLDGSTAVKERQELLDRFNSDTSIFCFLLSTRAGGMGINLTAADTVILHDVDFNPQIDRQAEDRCHRIGQTKPVTVIKLVVQETVD